MGFVKSVLGKVRHLVKNLIRRFFVNAVGNRTGTLYRAVLIFQSVDKIMPLLLHDVKLFLRHGTADKVGSTVGISCDLAADFHNLLLIDHTAVGHRQNITQKLAFINGLLGVMAVIDIGVNRIRRTRTVKGNNRYQVFKTFRSEPA